MKAFLLIAVPMLVGCGADTFTFVFIEGGSDFDANVNDAPDAGEVIEASRTDVESSDALEASSFDAKDSSAPDSNMCPLSGPSECGAVIDAYCVHYASCCSQFPGQGSCASWGASSMLCKSHWSGAGFDCGSQKYSPNVCASSLACKNEIVSASCSSLFSSISPASANFSSCPAFWSQF